MERRVEDTSILRTRGAARRRDRVGARTRIWQGAKRREAEPGVSLMGGGTEGQREGLLAIL